MSKIEDYEFSPILRKDVELRQVMDSIRNILNNGKYQLAVVDGIPSWTGEEGDTVLMSSGGVYRLYSYLNGGWHYVALT